MKILVVLSLLFFAAVYLIVAASTTVTAPTQFAGDNSVSPSQYF